MFRKVHFRLAALCAGITTLILLVMSCGYLYISERSLQKNNYTSFQNDMNTLVSNLEQQTVITHEWLTKMEDHGKYRIQVIDNEVPFLFNERNDDETRELFQTAWEQYASNLEAQPVYSDYYTFHTEFSFSSAGARQADHYACVAISERNSGTLKVLILEPLAPLKSQIKTQRLLFLTLNLAAILMVSLFSWYFTGQLLKPLRENQQKQMQFISSASHELRTPLAVILSCISASRQADESERAQFLDSIQAEGLRMSRLIDDMLLLTRADQNRWSIQMTPTELDTLLLNTFEAFEPMAAEHSVRLAIKLPEDTIPLCACDQERIRQVLAILLHNALSYTPAGGRIGLTLAWDGKHFQFIVEDTGIGIPDAEKERVFERFYRSDRSRSPKDHFGLGLCIAREIVETHRGKIRITDTPGGGATFTVTLPGSP